MSEQLWLGEARTVLDEPQAAFHFAFDDQDGVAVKRLLDSGYLLASPGTLRHCPVGGVLMGAVDLNLPDMAEADWTVTGDAWTTGDESAPRPFGRDDRATGTRCFAYRGTGAWSLTSKAEAVAGAPFWLRWITYSGKQGESTSTSVPLTLEFGGVWRLRLTASGRADLARRAALTDGDGRPVAGAYRSVTSFDWMTEAAYAPSVHWLWVYQVGPRLVVRSVQQATDGKPRGVTLLDPAPHVVPLPPNWQDRPPELLPKCRSHALHAGPWRLAGQGAITLCLAPQRFVAGAESELARGEPDTVGIEGVGKTTPVTVRLSGVVQQGPDTADGAVAPTVEVLDQDGAPWPTEEPREEPGTALTWAVRWTNTADSSVLLTAVDLVLPATWRSDGAVGVDLLATPGVAVQTVRVQREPDLARETAEVTALAYAAPLAAQLRENLPLRYVVDGVTRFRGLSTGGAWHVQQDTGAGPIGTLTLQAQGLWKRFSKARWPGGEPADGRPLVDVLREVLLAAGLSDDQIELPDSMAYVLPAPPEGQPPALVWRPGTSLDQILTDLRDRFFGTGWLFYHRLTDGAFVVAEVGDDLTPAADFHETAALAAAAGAPQVVIAHGSYEETLDASELANVVTVIGQDPDQQPLLARAGDWASIHGADGGALPFNYVGEPWHLIVADPGLATQGAVNWCCRTLFERVRWPRVYARWRSVRVDLFPGDVVRLVGPSYGGVYRLKGLELEKSSSGEALRPMGQATYAAERIA